MYLLALLLFHTFNLVIRMTTIVLTLELVQHVIKCKGCKSYQMQTLIKVANTIF